MQRNTPTTIALLPRALRRERGSALVFAIGLLAIFFVFGVAYVSRGILTLDAADLAVREARAREIATGGIYAAVGELSRGVLNGREGDVLGNVTYALPTYESIYGGTQVSLQALDNRKAEALVTISDESGKVNLNHAPASVLQSVLGVDGATARAITASLPSAGNASGQWLAAPEDLIARGLLTPEQYAQVNPALITTYTVLDHDNPSSHININRAAAEVWAALFGVPLDTAQKAYVKRPFTAVDGLLEALGKLPPAPEVAPVAYDANGQPIPAVPAPPAEPPVPASVTGTLSFASRCFRLVSEGTYAITTGGTEGKRARARVEAVVQFDDSGHYTFVYWSEAPASQTPAA